MEQFNRIEIQGIVGNTRVTTFPDSTLANISVATNYLYKTRDGQASVETTWFTVLARVGKAIEKPDSIVKGNAVHVTGRLRTRTYTDSEGIERVSYDVIANKINRIEGEGNSSAPNF